MLFVLGVLLVLGDLLADLGRRKALGHLSNSGLDAGRVESEASVPPAARHHPLRVNSRACGES
jgi:hypothetical protein